MRVAGASRVLSANPVLLPQPSPDGARSCGALMLRIFIFRITARQTITAQC